MDRGLNMFQSIQFRNFKVLKDTTLPLTPFTLIVGPNGSGKSTALQSLQYVTQTNINHYISFLSVGLDPSDKNPVEIDFRWGPPKQAALQARWIPKGGNLGFVPPGIQPPQDAELMVQKLMRTRIYTLNANNIAAPVSLSPRMELESNGGSLAGVLDRLRDEDPERFEQLNRELGKWLPEFDQILFETLKGGPRGILLRTRTGRHKIRAADLSQGTLLALAILTIAYIPEPPPIVGFEEPDRGIHPRLLRDVQDALYRLAYPEKSDERREPVQVVATTHSPYFLDLFKDHPEEIVIAQREGLEARFERLSKRADIDQILGQASLGEVWYSGILGGVPSER